MRRLLDPCNTLFEPLGKLTVAFSLVSAIAVFMSVLSLLIPARFVSVAVIIPMIPVNLIDATVNQPGSRIKFGRDWGLKSFGVLGAVLALAAVLAWIDFASHTLPARLGFSSPKIFEMPVIREIWFATVAITLFRAALIVVRSRVASHAIAKYPSAT